MELNPQQFAAFNPSEADYSGTAYQYSHGGKRNSTGIANMMGRFTADDTVAGVDTGSTTGGHMPHTSDASSYESFTPNTSQVEPN